MRSNHSDLQTLLLKCKEIERLNARFLQLLDEPLRQYCLVANANQHCLILLVANGSIATQMRFLTPDLLRKFKADSLLKSFRDIECKVRPTYTRPTAKTPQAMAPLSAATAEIVREIAESLVDQPLKEVMQRIGSKFSGNR